MEIQEPEPVPRHVAYHEAGHVIADLVLGFRFTLVTIRRDESGEYEGIVCGSDVPRKVGQGIVMHAECRRSGALESCAERAVQAVRSAASRWLGTTPHDAPA